MPTAIPKEIRQHWPILLTALFGAGVGVIGLPTYSLTLMSGPIADAFGWARSEVTICASFFVMGLVTAGPVAGRICDRIGARRTLLASTLAFAIALALLSRAGGSLGGFYAGYFLLAWAGAGTTFSIYGRVITTWFRQSRGLALGIMMSATGMAAALLPIVLPPVLDRWSWQGGYIMLSLLAASAFPVVYLLLKGSERLPFATQAAQDGMTLAQASRTRRLWAMLIGTFLFSFTVTGTHLNLVDMLERRGESKVFIHTALSLFGFSMVFGRLATGWLLDKLHGPFVAAVVFSATSITFTVLMFAHGWVIILGVCLLGLASSAEGDICAYLTGRYFGLRAYSEIFGWVFSALALGLAAGSATAGMLIAHFDSPRIWLMLSVVFALLSSLLFGTLGKYPTALPVEESSTAAETTDLQANASSESRSSMA